MRWQDAKFKCLLNKNQMLCSLDRYNYEIAMDRTTSDDPLGKRSDV